MTFNLVCWCIRRDKQIDYAVILDRHRWISWLLFHGWLCLRSIINTLVMSFLGGADIPGCIDTRRGPLMWLKYSWTNGVSYSSPPSSLAQVVGAPTAPTLTPENGSHQSLPLSSHGFNPHTRQHLIWPFDLIMLRSACDYSISGGWENRN